jgi:hypothetical protein
MTGTVREISLVLPLSGALEVREYAGHTHTRFANT